MKQKNHKLFIFPSGNEKIIIKSNLMRVWGDDMGEKMVTNRTVKPCKHIIACQNL